MPTALIADDEPNLSAELAERLAELWPELEIVATPRNGVDTLAALNAARPDIAFLDIRMPGIDGLKLASLVPDVHVVFVTAYDEYAIRDRGVRALGHRLSAQARDRRASSALHREAAARRLRAGRRSRRRFAG
ncbi:DNA-binding response regulator [Burkholderia pseudomallei]|nr:DNA-binding response regulator [Burkholderia pseudomallei]CAJ3257771.1 DNA-binding response regulator [Burkholderia pseudomallei]CAJ3273936.1 DNA-binding response regulator [Burkholderia pseudomallei]CAJ3696520.1 DNA-binding response regulator [Burkholderia pseudomallei]CAJ4167410.1 DNA-binding response regulator [Burkholderia pseudomallei]